MTQRPIRADGQGCLVVFVAVVIACLHSQGAFAHDVWFTATQDKAELRIYVHYGHPGDRKRPDPDKLFALTLHDGPDRRSLLPGLERLALDGLPLLAAAPIPVGEPRRPWLVEGRYDNGYWVKTSQGYRNTSKQQVPDAEESFSSIKFAKMLLPTQGADPDGYGRIIGHRLELVPLDNPFMVGAGGVVKVRVLFEGKPLAGVLVERGDGLTPMAEQEIPRYRTDAEGVTLVSIPSPGPHLLVVDHEVPSTHQDLAATERYSATLSFVLASPDHR